MSAPTSVHAHDLTALADRLRRRINDAMARLDAEIDAEIAAFAQVQADRPSGEGGPQVLTPSETARLIGRSRSWTEAQIKAGRIPATRIGSRWWCKLSGLQAGGWA